MYVMCVSLQRKILTERASNLLRQKGVVLTGVSYHSNVLVSILVNQWLPLTMRRAVDPCWLMQIGGPHSIVSPRIRKFDIKQ